MTNQYPTNESPKVGGATKNRRIAFGAGMLATGLVAGAMFSPIGLAGAQDDDAPDASTAENDRGRFPELREHREHRGEVLESLGLDAETVRAGFEADMTLVEIAAENGVSEADLASAIEADIESHIADAVESGRLTQEQADEKLSELSDKVTERINTRPSERPERDRPGHRGHRFGAGEVLEELGLTADDLRAGREAGQTLAETAEANGVSEEDLVAALVAQATERAEAAIESGRVDEDRVAEMLEGLEEKITERINAEPGDRPDRPFRPGRGEGPGSAGETETSSLSF